MAAVALDLTPVVDQLVEHPFDDVALRDARAAVDGHAQAYATTLRCAAKRANDALAAAYWLTEAARVHESIDDIGGAIALLSRAWDCDPGNARTRELLAGYMTRLGARVGLGFFSNPIAAEEPATQSEPVVELRRGHIESGIRPSPPDTTRAKMDTLPGVGEPPPSLDTLHRSILAARAEQESQADAELAADEEWERTTDVQPLAAERGAAENVPRVEERNAIAPPPGPASLRDLELEVATRRSSEMPHTPPLMELEIEEDLLDEPLPEDVYGTTTGPSTNRPVGDRLVGALFEALHELHFIEDIREGADFVARVVAEKTRAKAVLVHLHDINTRQFVVVSAVGQRASALLDWVTADDDAFIAEVMSEREAVVVLDPDADPRFARGRFRLVEPGHSLLCAPALTDHRYLGLIEITDPLDGTEFTEDDRNAMTYVADTFGQFLTRLGVVLSEEPKFESRPMAASQPPVF